MKFNTHGYQKKMIIAVMLSLSLLFLQGCGSGKKGITIDSAPQGADILADGKKIGKTPMQISQDQYFPPRWYGTSYQVKGQLALQMEGCEPVSMEVNDLVLSKDIRKDLKCDTKMMQPSPAVHAPEKPKPDTKQPAMHKAAPASVPAASTATTEPPAPAPSKKSVADDDIEKRLSKLKGLLDRGAITSDEYASQRQRILDSI